MGSQEIQAASAHAATASPARSRRSAYSATSKADAGTSAPIQVSAGNPAPCAITAPPSHAPKALPRLNAPMFRLEARLCAPQSPQELAQHNCLLLFDSHRRRDHWHLRHADGAEAEVRVTGRLESTLGELLRDAAVAGEGIAMFSYWHVAADLREGRLQVVLPEWTVPETGIHAVMPQRRFVPPRVRAFVDFLGEKFGDVPPWEK